MPPAVTAAPGRHPGESRGPLNLDSGLRRNDDHIIDWIAI